MGKNDTPAGFAEMIEAAQRLPDPVAEQGSDMSSPFPRALPPTHRIVDNVKHGGIPGFTAYNFESHVKYYVIPTNADEYEGVLNMILNGQAMLRYEDRTFTKDGDFLIAICYLTFKKNAEEKKTRDDDDDEERLS